MDLEEYKEQALKMVDFLYNFHKNADNQRVIPDDDVKPNALFKKMSDDAPEEGEKFDDIMEEFKEKLMPMLVYWNHPKFFAYFPAGMSYTSFLAEMLSTSINQNGFTWQSSPALTEHEQIALNMLAKVLKLPRHFLFDPQDKETGGGAMQASASDCVLLALLIARARAVSILRGGHKIHESAFLPQFVAYTSEEAHSSIEKAAKIAIIRLRILPTNENGVLEGKTVEEAIAHDFSEGMIPIFVNATVGTTGVCSFDNIDQIGKVCKRYKTIWYHVDGAYAGNAFILPEMDEFKQGIEYADSFNVNPNKWLMTSFDCSCFFTRSIKELKFAMAVHPAYLEFESYEAQNLRHFGVPLSRRFRSLKLWFVLRNYGIKGLQAIIRNHISCAKYFASLVQSDERLVVVNQVHLGLVCFRIYKPKIPADILDKINAELLSKINASGELHMIPHVFQNKYILRFCVTHEKATNQQMDDAWEKIKKFTDEVLSEYHFRTLSFQVEGPRSLNPRYSFIRTVMFDSVGDQNQLHLKDNSTVDLVYTNGETRHYNEN